MTPCGVDDCGNEAKKAGLCWAHYKRKVRGRPLSTPVQEHAKTPWQGLMNAVIELADAAAEVPDGKVDKVAMWKRIQGRFRKALDRYNARMRQRRARKDTVPRRADAE